MSNLRRISVCDKVRNGDVDDLWDKLLNDDKTKKEKESEIPSKRRAEKEDKNTKINRHVNKKVKSEVKAKVEEEKKDEHKNKDIYEFPNSYNYNSFGSDCYSLNSLEQEDEIPDGQSKIIELTKLFENLTINPSIKESKLILKILISSEFKTLLISTRIKSSTEESLMLRRLLSSISGYIHSLPPRFSSSNNKERKGSNDASWLLPCIAISIISLRCGQSITALNVLCYYVSDFTSFESEIFKDAKCVEKLQTCINQLGLRIEPNDLSPGLLSLTTLCQIFKREQKELNLDKREREVSLSLNGDSNKNDKISIESMELKTSLLSKYEEIVSGDMIQKIIKNILNVTDKNISSLLFHRIAILVSMSEKTRKYSSVQVKSISLRLKEIINEYNLKFLAKKSTDEEYSKLISNIFGFLSNICHGNKDTSEECTKTLGNKILLDINWCPEESIKAQQTNLIANISLASQGVEQLFEDEEHINKYIENIYNCCMTQKDVGLKYSATIALCSFSISAPKHLKEVVSSKGNFARIMLEMCKMLGEFLTIQKAAGIASNDTRLTLLSLVKSVKKLTMEGIKDRTTTQEDKS